MLFLVVLFCLMLDCLCVNVSFTMFVLQWVYDQLMSHLAPLIARHFQRTILFSHSFHGK